MAPRAAELEAGGEALSGQINEAVGVEIERRRRRRLLSEFLDALDAERGAVDEHPHRRAGDQL